MRDRVSHKSGVAGFSVANCFSSGLGAVSRCTRFCSACSVCREDRSHSLHPDDVPKNDCTPSFGAPVRPTFEPQYITHVLVAEPYAAREPLVDYSSFFCMTVQILGAGAPCCCSHTGTGQDLGIKHLTRAYTRRTRLSCVADTRARTRHCGPDAHLEIL